ncbi:hypothetical protein GXW82_43235 [Streptacidiphilus sp. 4-A2]|nr:hypothetical protein [Streptacidiphilus sp. 4-A2]
MRPYDIRIDPETGKEGCNPFGEWDWWHMSSNDSLVALPPYDGDPRLLFEPSLPSGEVRPRGPLRCDGGPRGLLDFEGMRAAAAARAAATWAASHVDGPADLHSPTEEQPQASISGDRSAFIERAAVLAVPTYALITLDGRWADPLDPSPLQEQASPEEDYWPLADRYLLGLPEDVLVVQLLCHG